MLEHLVKLSIGYYLEIKNFQPFNSKEIGCFRERITNPENLKDRDNQQERLRISKL